MVASLVLKRFQIGFLGSGIILKVVTPPSIEDFDHLIAKARSEAKKAGLRKSDIQKLIKKVRKEK